mmetsp:Transcript_21179/g.63737  ORF Transcript_21179/g.63737 Transcript_21179/m.63737 type:complete len:583 (-) Transcript_21179:106-1854(-)
MPAMASVSSFAGKSSAHAAREIITLLVVATVGLSVLNYSSLTRLVRRQRIVRLAAAGDDGSWHDMLNKVEHNIEAHLPLHHRSLIQQDLSQLTFGEQPKARTDSVGAGELGSGTAKLPSRPPPPASRSRRKASESSCNVEYNTEYGSGDVVVWGATNKVDTWGACCQQCLDFKPLPGSTMNCTAWVWCGEKGGCKNQFQECWLKHMAHPGIASPHKGNPSDPVFWTSGLFDPEAEQVEQQEPEDLNEDRSFHTIITAEGAATHWQSRIHYYWFSKIRARCQLEGPCHMGGFTRILHTGQADDLMNEIPTFVAQPLPKNKADHKGYVVLNRPYAIMQWVQQTTIREKYIIMSEPDHVWLKPMANIMRGQHPAAFAFFYISPSEPALNLRLTQKYTGPITKKEAENISPMGNAPTMMAWDDLARVAPKWMNLSVAIFNDEETAKEWGWVQEMYAFTIACYLEKVPKVTLHKQMMAQPPWDSDMEPFYLLHFTYGVDYDHRGKFTPGKYGEWRFDKRTYGASPPPRNLGQPPPGMQNHLVQHLLNAVNEATAAIPGWDDYAATGVATQWWDGVTFSSPIAGAGRE